MITTTRTSPTFFSLLLLPLLLNVVGLRQVVSAPVTSSFTNRTSGAILFDGLSQAALHHPVSVPVSSFRSPSVSSRASAQDSHIPPAPTPWYVRYTTGLFILFVHFTSTLPWAVVAAFDAIDSKYRTSQQVAYRLALSSCFLLLGYVCGIVFVVALILDDAHTKDSITKSTTPTKGRHDEIATILVLLIFNLWHVARNLRGWAQYIALRRLDTPFRMLQQNFALSLPINPVRPPTPPTVALNPRPSQPLVQGLERLRISSRLIENDFGTSTPFLRPRRLDRGDAPGDTNIWRLLRRRRRSSSNNGDVSIHGNSISCSPCLHPHHYHHNHLRGSHDHCQNVTERDVWAVALWRAWWTQDTRLMPKDFNDLSVDDRSFSCDRENLVHVAYKLLDSHPSGLEPHPVTDGGPPVVPRVTDQRGDATNVISTREQWAEALKHYGTTPGRAPGQQDTSDVGVLTDRMRTSDASGIAILVLEKTTIPPNRMSLLWYDTARFEQVYEQVALDPETARLAPSITFPSTLAAWQNLAMDIATNLDLPFNLTDKLVITFAGELAAASVLLVRFPKEFRALVEVVYQDGLNARWTFGWSGLLACFSHLWTRERVFVAMLNGLSLIALTRYGGQVKSIDPNVRAMMYGYAAFAVSNRAVGKRVAEHRNKELLYRYRNNKGKTCRGSGLNATRIACRELGLPEEASHMDGLPAFSTGWASEFMQRLPGNQEPQHGRTHEEAEKIEGSGPTWRYPHSCL